MGSDTEGLDWFWQIVMDLCHGDITKKEWVLWHVTFEDAIGWTKHIMKRRYEWMEVIAKILGADNQEGKQKKCADVRVCNICRKTCSQRIGNTVH
jgi:hypothetical protein